MSNNNVYDTLGMQLLVYRLGMMASITKPRRVHKTLTINQKMKLLDEI